MKRFHYIPSCLILLLFCCMTSCCDSKRKAYEEAVIEWTGKKILFPDSMRLVGGGMIAKPDADFTIVSYYDSIGCTGCRMKLRFWNEFMQRVDSVRGDKTVRLLVIASGIDEKELRLLAEREMYRYNMIWDKEGVFYNLNRFPQDACLQTFLLDGNNRVVGIGNPLDIQGVASLYFSKIGDNFISFQEDRCNIEYDFGNIPQGKKVSHEFQLLNQNSDTVMVREVTTSCECTEARVLPTIIPPNQPYSVMVSFCDTIIGNFTRSVTISLENNTDIYFEISGKVISNV